MKFQKGLITDQREPEAKPQRESPPSDEVRKDSAIPGDRLFQTHRRTARSWKQYLKVLAVVSVFVVIASGAIFYFTLPRYGDLVRAPHGLEQAVRTHFLDVEKRTATDIEFYYCETYYWARVDVETRPDIQTNPIFQIGTYTARGSSDAGWNITASPAEGPERAEPCS